MTVSTRLLFMNSCFNVVRSKELSLRFKRFRENMGKPICLNFELFAGEDMQESVCRALVGSCPPSPKGKPVDCGDVIGVVEF